MEERQGKQGLRSAPSLSNSALRATEVAKGMHRISHQRRQEKEHIRTARELAANLMPGADRDMDETIRGWHLVDELSGVSKLEGMTVKRIFYPGEDRTTLACSSGDNCSMNSIISGEWEGIMGINLNPGGWDGKGRTIKVTYSERVDDQPYEDGPFSMSEFQELGHTVVYRDMLGRAQQYKPQKKGSSK